MELSILREQIGQDWILWHVNIYLGGKLSNSQDTLSSNFVYKLKTDDNKKYLKV